MKILLIVFLFSTISFSKTYTIFFASTKYEDVAKEYYQDIRFHTPDFYKVAIRKHIKKNYSVIIREVPTLKKALKVQKLLLSAGKYKDSYIKSYEEEPIYEILYVEDRYKLIKPYKKRFKQDIENSNDYITATVLYNTSKFNEAYLMFYELFLKENYNFNINYFLAKSAFNTKRFDQSLAAFERVISLKPDFLQGRYDYAKVLFHLKQDKEAKEELEYLLKTDINKKTKSEIKKYLKIIAGKKSRLSGQAFFMFGVERSSNVNNGLSNTEYRLPGLGDILVEGENPIADNAHFEILGINLYNYLKKQAIQIKNSFLVYNKTYQNETDYNILLFSYKPSVTYKDTNSGLSYVLESGLDRVVKKTDEDFYSYSISPKIYNKYFQAYLKYQRVSYLNEAYKEKDLETVQIYGKINLFKYANYYSTFYKNMRVEDLRTDIDKKTFGNGINLFYNLTPNNKINLNYQFDISRYKYENIGFDTKREDKKHFANISLTHNLSKSDQLNLSFIYLKNNSNQEAYVYDEKGFRFNYLKSISW